MSFIDDIRGDYVILDGAVTVTLTRNNVDTTVVGVTRQRLSSEEVAMLGGISLQGKTLRVFSLPVATLGGVTPKKSDTLTDDQDNDWQVLSVDLSSFGTRYMLTCQLNAI